MNATFIGDMWKKREYFRWIFEVKVCRYYGSLYFPLQEAVQNEKRKKCSPFFHSSFRLPETFGHFKYHGRISTRWQSTSKLTTNLWTSIDKKLGSIKKRYSTSKDLKKKSQPKNSRRGALVYVFKSHTSWVGNPQTGEYLYHRNSPTGLRDLTLIPGFQPRGSTSGGGAPRTVHLEDQWGLILGATYDWGKQRLYSQKVHTRSSMYWDPQQK